MKYITHNDMDINIDASHLLKHINADYTLLCKLFGQPWSPPDHKVDAEWKVEFEDGVKVSIYNWKNGKNFLGWSGTPTEDIAGWSVGGYQADHGVGLERVEALLADPRVLTIQGHITHDDHVKEVTNGN